MKRVICLTIILNIILIMILVSFTGCSKSTPSSEKGIHAGNRAADDILTLVGKNVQASGQQHYLKLFGNEILGLYKSSDGQREQENEIFYHLSNILKSQGFTLRYWDIDQAIPAMEDLKGVRAVISWFRGASLVNPDRYLDFFDTTVKSGRKFIVIDNFGAYQYRNEPDKYTDISRLNLSLSRLGLQYLGDWTQDASQLRITFKDSAMVEAGAQQDLTATAFYYRFLQTDRLLKTWLAVQRKDLMTPPSNVIVTNRNGGFALSGYIFREINQKPVFMLNLEKFLQAALYLPKAEQQIGILANPSNPYSAMVLKETEDLFIRSSVAFKVITADQFKYLTAGDLQQFTTLALVLSTEKDLKAAVFKEYMEKGGNIISLLNGSFKNLAPLFLSRYVDIPDKAKKIGFHILPGFVMGKNLSLKDSRNEWRPGYLLPEKENTILGYDAEQSYPLLWTGSLGKGRFLIWNWDGFLGDQLIGLILESVLYIQPAGACTTLGFAHMFIDDWPLPMYTSTKEGFDVSFHDFYVNTWWPDIQKFMASYNIPYSAYVIFNYNAVVDPPFTGSEFYSAGDESVQIARKLLDRGVELGYHGYNHMSLTREKTAVNLRNWPGVDSMIASITEGKRTWTALFGEATLPFAYVPVNNIISEEGVAALHIAMPSVKIVAPLRWGVEEETYSPIMPHPYIPGIYYFPRISFGYKKTDTVLNLIVSGVNGPGLISHFIHPDDVFDPVRSAGKTWEQLLADFRSIIDFTAAQYPWMKWITIREVYQHLLAQDNVLCSFVQDGNRLEISARKGTLLRIRARAYADIRALEGAEPVYAYPDQQTYILKATADRVLVEF